LHFSLDTIPATSLACGEVRIADPRGGDPVAKKKKAAKKKKR
jgi:hypothetical protein